MSGRIYDSGINPKCNICGSDMWTSTERNFNGCKCKKEGCEGGPIYEPFIITNNPFMSKPIGRKIRINKIFYGED